MTDWREIVIQTTTDCAEDVAGRLASALEDARSGAELRPSGEVVYWVSADRAEAALAAFRQAVAKLAAEGLPVSPETVEHRAARPEEEWREAWKKYFHTTRLTRQIVVVPSWETFEPAPDDVVIDLDPGQAFGTGAHASTQLVLSDLQWLRDHSAEVDSMLDVGAGSGILAIATVKLWPGSRAQAIDIDPVAVEVCHENCESNRVADRIDCSTRDLDDIRERFDLVVANIQASVLEPLRDSLASRIQTPGWLLLSGLLTTQAEAIAAHYAELAALEIDAITRSDRDPEWSAVRLRCRG